MKNLYQFTYKNANGQVLLVKNHLITEGKLDFFFATHYQKMQAIVGMLDLPFDVLTGTNDLYNSNKYNSTNRVGSVDIKMI